MFCVCVCIDIALYWFSWVNGSLDMQIMSLFPLQIEQFTFYANLKLGMHNFDFILLFFNTLPNVICSLLNVRRLSNA